MSLRQAPLASLALLSAYKVSAHVSTGRNGNGLIGVTMEMYQPGCAFACRDVIAGSSLACTGSDDDGTSHMHDVDGMDMETSMHDSETSPECYATDDSFLQTLAYCMSQRCDGVSNSTLEEFWQKNVAGRNKVQPLPKEPYLQALAKITTPPVDTMTYGDPLNQTQLVGDDDYEQNFNGDQAFERNERLGSIYSLVVFLSGVIVPMLFSLLRFAPWPATLVTKFNAHVIDPPAFGRKHRTPVAGFALIPTRGQALFIFYLTAINIILCAVSYQSWQPNAWYPDTAQEIENYVSNRCGILAMSNMALLILYAGRNNVLLWLTNWSHSTFLLVHRYIALIATLQAVIHSVIYLQWFVMTDGYAAERQINYWQWGAAATVCLSILLQTSILPIRKAAYEIFLAWHVIVATMAVVGTYYHIVTRYDRQWGYETWMYVAIGFWALDHVLRWVRLAINGVKHATLTVIDSEYVRVDVPGVKGDGHAYLYFPTLTWRVWENHPFSVATTDLRRAAISKQHVHLDEEKQAVARSDSESNNSRAQDSTSMKGTTFLLRVRGGLTKKLAAAGSVPVLVEAAYGRHERVSASSHLICIAGGVGITAILPYLHKSDCVRTKLYWGARTSSLFEAMNDDLGGVEIERVVGQRMNIVEILEKEVEVAKTEGDREVVVVVSGPSGMADDTRLAVCALAKNVKGPKIKFVEEAFSW